MPISDGESRDAGFALRLRTEDVVQALANSNPGAARGVLERTGRVVTLISEVVLNDADAIRLVMGLDPAAMSDVLRDIASSLRGLAEDGGRAAQPREPERVQGAGLGEVVGRDAGLVRLSQHASMAELEDWAGPTVDVDGVLSAEGVTADVLDGWRRSRAVVELADGNHRPVFPAGQFSGHRPVPGLAEVQAIVGDASTAWLWLVEPNHDGTPSWLDLLRRERTAEVLEAARQDFR